MLHVDDDQVVDGAGNPVRLRGVCVGGWMNMENFIDGYPGDEHTQRAVMATILGRERAQFFFDRLLDYFLAEEDIAFIKSWGANSVCLALNYRHFESDARPFECLEAGFRRLDQVVEWCTQHGLYAILDLHGFDAREKQPFNMLVQGIVDPHDGRQAFPGTRRRLLHATDHRSFDPLSRTSGES